MTDDRLRRCAIHGPEMRAYVEALVAAERELIADAEAMGLREAITDTLRTGLAGGATIVTEDDGGWDE